LTEKYGVPCPAEKLVEKLKTLCPCYEDADIEYYLEKWNEIHSGELPFHRKPGQDMALSREVGSGPKNRQL
jgi:hypothetical protein